MFRHDETSEHDVGHRLMSLPHFISQSPRVEVAPGREALPLHTHRPRSQMLSRGGHRFPDWTFGFKQSSLTPIARVLRHLTLQHFQVSIAFTAIGRTHRALIGSQTRFRCVSLRTGRTNFSVSGSPAILRNILLLNVLHWLICLAHTVVRAQLNGLLPFAL